MGYLLASYAAISTRCADTSTTSKLNDEGLLVREQEFIGFQNDDFEVKTGKPTCQIQTMIAQTAFMSQRQKLKLTDLSNQELA